MFSVGIALIMIFLGALWLALTLGATVIVAFSDLQPLSRRALLILIAWIVPILGSFLAFYLSERPVASTHRSAQ
jgi:hypothetical protein